MSPLKAFPLGLQHFLSMFGATVLVPMLMGFSPSISVMSSGIGTALYLLVTKGKIPSYLGPSFSFIGPIVMASAAAVITVMTTRMVFFSIWSRLGIFGIRLLQRGLIMQANRCRNLGNAR